MSLDIPITLSVDILNPECTQEKLEYIFDCWTTFVTQDLGWDASDAIMVEVGRELADMRLAVAPQLPPL